MGLDLYCVHLEVERRFDLTLLPEDWAELHTVGELVALIRARLRRAGEAGLTLRAFLQLRELLRDVTGDDAFRARPSERLVDRLSPSQRRALWKRLPALFGGTPPPLALGPLGCGAGLALGGAAVGAVLISVLPTHWADGSVRFIPAVVAGAALGGVGLVLIQDRLQTRPPRGYRTVGELARRLAGRGASADPRGDPGEAAVLEELRAILTRELGVDADEVVPAARFVEDLGAC